MIESLFTFESTRLRQRSAPLLDEREQFLNHILDQGTSRQRARTVATMLLHIIRLMEFTRLRVVEEKEIERACQRWLVDTESHKKRRVGPHSSESFTFTAKKWFRFLNLIVQSEVSRRAPVQPSVQEFESFLEGRGIAPCSIRTYGSRMAHFLNWAAAHNKELSVVSLDDVDVFLESKREEGCLPRTIASYCSAFRIFFQYAEMRGWNPNKFASSIHGPRISRYDRIPKGPRWKDIRNLLDSNLITGPADLRAVAMLSLCSIYALRAGEVVNFNLNDFDWANETFTVRRAKRGRVQQFPLQFEVGERILRYLQNGRPRCACRHLFVTLKPPYRPVRSATIWTVIAKRIERLGISLGNFGPHSLRHACATHLLHKGCALKDIADFLGHRGMASVSIYARFDVRSLKQVANFSLTGVK